MRFAPIITVRWTRQSAIAALVLTAFLASSFGVPILRPPKDLSQPFPCQDNPCGCSSAEQCWRHCCCHTNQEKLAWAKEHNITPPDYVIDAARRESEEAVAQHSCHKCSHGHESTAPQSRSCCKSQVRPERKKLQVGFINSDLARRCHGVPGLIFIANVLSLPELPAVWSFEPVVVGCVWEQPVPWLTAERSPPVPPPKLSASAA